MTIPNLKQIVSAQIQRFSGLGAQWPSFPESLEPRFEEETSSRRCGRLWLEGLLAICLYDLLLIADHLGPPPYFMRALVVRAGIITPIALAVNLSMLYRPRKVLREGSIAVVACLAGLTHLWLESNRSPAASAYAQFGVLAVLLFANTLMRLRLPYALATSATMVVGDVVFLHADRMLSYEEKVLGFCLTLSTVVVTVIANYSANRDERMGYLLFLERDMLVEDLNRSNERLTRMAESDALTGLANRHAFNATLLDYWRGDCEERTLLSAIMVDVDHFKQMNDTYGHLYGDKVLQRISRLLVESLRREGDFAARFGGEEFMILLPGTSEPEAIMVAERIRRLVEMAGLPAMERSTGALTSILRATVSCGVATEDPALCDKPQFLLDAADRALYRAKASGRNCVCSNTSLLNERTA